MGNSFEVFSNYVVNKIKRKNRPKVNFFIDKKFTKKLKSSKCLPPSFIFNTKALKKYKKTLIIVCIGNSTVNQPVCRRLIKFGYVKVFSMYEFEDFHCAYDSKSVNQIGKELDKYNNLYPRFASEIFFDDRSRRVFSAFQSSFYFSENPKIPKNVKSDEQIEVEIKFIDSNIDAIKLLSAGSYDGEILNRLSYQLPKIKGTVFFCEPNRENYLRTVSTSKSTSCKLNIVTIPVALGKKFSYINIQGSGVTSRTVKNTNRSYQIVKVPIDFLFDKQGLSHILIDVEGEELDVLSGAKQLIMKSAPNICISVYHHPSDIFRIPIYLHKLQPKYRFYLRNYSGFNTDTLLYCIAR